MERFVLKRTGQRPLAFQGERLFSGSTSPDRAHPDYSGSPSSWMEVEVYRTDKGKFVLSIGRFSTYNGYKERFRVLVFDSLEELVGYLEEEIPYWAEKVSLQLGVVEEL